MSTSLAERIRRRIAEYQKDPRGKHLRYGQLAYLALAAISDPAADLILGTSADPFYENGNLPAFWEYVHSLGDI